LTPLHGWAPQFDKLTADDVQSGIKALLPLLHTRLDELEKQIGSFDASATVDEQWKNVVEAVEKLGEELDHAWSTIAHLQVILRSEFLSSFYRYIIYFCISTGRS
jgi:Zn-dependent oligopeptidase